MQPRHTAVQVRKQIMLGLTEANFIEDILKAFSVYPLKDKINSLTEIREAFVIQDGILKNLRDQYHELGSAWFRFNETEKLEQSYHDAATVRETMNQLFAKLMAEYIKLLTEAVPAHKNMILSGLSDAGEYRDNLRMHERNGTLERVNIGGTDYSDLQKAKKVLHDAKKYLDQLSLSFDQQFLQKQSAATNELRHVKTRQDNTQDGGDKIKQTVSTYQSELVVLRQTMMAAGNRLLDTNTDVHRAARLAHRLFEETNPIARLPQTYPVPQSELVTKRVDDLSPAQVAAIKLRYKQW